MSELPEFVTRVEIYLDNFYGGSICHELRKDHLTIYGELKLEQSLWSSAKSLDGTLGRECVNGSEELKLCTSIYLSKHGQSC